LKLSFEVSVHTVGCIHFDHVGQGLSWETSQYYSTLNCLFEKQIARNSFFEACRNIRF
jgi:hypothetical protein